MDDVGICGISRDQVSALSISLQGGKRVGVRERVIANKLQSMRFRYDEKLI